MRMLLFSKETLSSFQNVLKKLSIMNATLPSVSIGRRCAAMLCLLLVTLAARAYFDVDGVRYEVINERKALVEVAAGITYAGDIVIPDTVSNGGKDYCVVSVADEAFICCSELLSVQLPATLTTIGSHAFNWCSRLADIVLPKGLASIGEYSFCYCDSLAAVTLPAGLSTIGENAFSWSGLKAVEIPEGNVAVGNYAFSHCARLTEITLPDGMSAIGDYVFGWCSALPTVSLPEGLSAIGGMAFCNCTSLMSVLFPSTLQTIGRSAFHGCSCLQSVTIPASVTTIGTSAFSGCSAITSVTCEGFVPPVCQGAIFDAAIYRDVPLSVAYGSGDAYRAATGWSNFAIVDDPSALLSLPSEQPTVVYDLNGRALPAADTTLGIYVVNGRKMLVR